MAIPFARVLVPVILGMLSGSARATSDVADRGFIQAPGEVRLKSPDNVIQNGLGRAIGQVGELYDNTPRVLTLDLTRDANDIWDRIRRGFGMPDLDSELVAEQQLFYLNRPAFLKKVFERGGRYLWHIVDELERRGMPTELALLPMVESSYNPMAYSRSHASGLWQFIPSTGRSYNLTQDSWVDERRDVIASTAAALDYLQTIYDMHGDWQLALASYNWGENAVGRAIQRNQSEGLPTDYSHLRMPDETRNYVPKLQALKNIVAQPELFHIELPYVPNSRHFVTIDTPAGIDLATAARLAEMPLDEFIALNPSHNRAAITGGSSLVVPVDRAEKFQLRLAEQLREGKRWRTHELQHGETLASVARAFGLSAADLSQLNGLNPASRIGPGYSLLVPDGVDPAGALDAARLVPRPAEATGLGLSLTASGIRSSVKTDVKPEGATKKDLKKKGAGKPGSKDATKGGVRGASKAKAPSANTTPNASRKPSAASATRNKSATPQSAGRKATERRN
jgi:membrane-bound lytic murein transglycosylase D